MGQRHQLFVIAKINGRYRSLAAVHHQWLYGHTALRTCLRLLKIFGDPRNHRLLENEIARAERFGEEVWNESINFRDSSTTKFPFVTTCLVVGTGYDFSTGDVSNVSPEPWNLDFDEGDNNDGVTILDVSDPEKPRYCFVVWTDDYEPEAGSKRMTPLRGADYLLLYYPEKEWDSNMERLVEHLDRHSLIQTTNLNETWPRPDWTSRTDRGWQPVEDVESTVEVDDENSKKSLTAMSLEQSIEKLLDEEDDNSHAVEQLPMFQCYLRSYLYQNPKAVTTRLFGISLLQKALKASQKVDLAKFPDISADQMFHLLQGLCAANSHVLDLLDISNCTKITKDDLSAILNQFSIHTLCAWDNPQLPLAELSVFLASGRLKHLLHPDLFATPINYFQNKVERSWFASDDEEEDAKDPYPFSQPLSPFRQLVWFQSLEEKSDSSPSQLSSSHLDNLQTQGWRDTVSSLMVAGLHDTPIDSAASLLSSLSRLMQCIAKTRTDNKLVLPYSLALRDPDSPYAISAMPAHLYANARAMYHSSSAKVPRTMVPLTGGEWTVIIVESCSDVFFVDKVRLAFLTLKGGEMKVVDLKGFAEEFGCEDYLAK